MNEYGTEEMDKDEDEGMTKGGRLGKDTVLCGTCKNYGNTRKESELDGRDGLKRRRRKVKR